MRLVTNRQARCVLLTTDLEIPSTNCFASSMQSCLNILSRNLGLALGAPRHANAEVCDHFHAYNDAHGLMQWYDAFSGDPLLVDASIPEASVQSFCRKLGVNYARWRASKYLSHSPQEAN
jgi:hypothetical protein